MQAAEKLLKLIKKSCERIPPGSALAFSGGLDSSLMAALMKKPKLYVVGVEGSHDLAAAGSAAELLGLELNKIIIGEAEIKEAATELKALLAGLVPARRLRLAIAYNMPLYLVCKHCKEHSIAVAQGPDEMLGGYAKYQKMQPDKARLEMLQDTRDLVTSGFKQCATICARWGKRLFLPYLDGKVVDFCLQAPQGWRIRKGKRKFILVEAAKLVLPASIAERPKKAAQYGSGIMKAMKDG